MAILWRDGFRPPLHCHRHEITMPIAIDEPNRIYQPLVREGRLKLPKGKLCPREGTATLVMSKWVVNRGLIVMEKDSSGEWFTDEKVIVVAVARCLSCKGRFRVLPSDVLPHKTYGLCIIEFECTVYAEGERTLRDVAWRLFYEQKSARMPAHATLHAWTEGGGAWSLGREPGEVSRTEPFGVLLAETRRRWPREVQAVFEQPVSIDPRRYRSEERRERLVAVVRVFAVAIAIAKAKENRPLCAWFQLAQTPAFGLLWPASFRTGLSCTPSEHLDAGNREARGPTPHLRGPRCPTNTRSPPGASNRSLPSSTKASVAPRDVARYGSGPNAKSNGLAVRRSA